MPHELLVKSLFLVILSCSIGLAAPSQSNIDINSKYLNSKPYNLNILVKISELEKRLVELEKEFNFALTRNEKGHLLLEIFYIKGKIDALKEL